MSDPAKSPEEIEDVLASIRRLVSDHGAAGQRAQRPATGPHLADPADGPAAQAKPAEALVLAPSFRVSDPDDPWVSVPDAAAADHPELDHSELDHSELDDDLTAAQISEAVLAETIGAADVTHDRSDGGADGGADWQPDDRLAHFDVVGGEGASGADTSDVPMDLHLAGDADRDAIAADLPEAEGPVDAQFDALDNVSEEDITDLVRLDGAAAAPEVAEFESETGDDNWPGDGAEAALLSLVARRDPVAEDVRELENPAQEPLQAANPSVPFVDPEAFEAACPEDDAAPSDAAAAEDVVAVEPEPVDDAAHEPAPDPGMDSAAPEPQSTAAEAGDHDAAAMETVEDAEPTRPIFSRRVQPDAPETPDAPDTSDTSADPQADAHGTDVDDLGAEPSPFAFPDPEDGILDEDTLREIIVDVVREELQGVLGQRITRNVRKMVRREIRLALAAEDLE